MFFLRQYPAWEPLRKSALRLGRNIVLSTLGAALLVAVKDFTPDLDQGETPANTPAVTASIAPDPIGARTIRGVIRAGKGFSENLLLAGLSPEVIPHVVERLSPKLDFQRLKTGDRFTVVVDHGGDLVSLTYEKSVREALVLRSGPGGWRTELAPLPVETRVEEVRGTIRSSLFESMSAAGETDALTLGFVELFAWDIDFSNELQPGDTFRVVVEKVYRDGRFVEYGRLLAAEYRDRSETHRAYWYPWPDARGEYYTTEGKSVRAAFLRSPISYTRISSGFSYARRHPLLNTVRPHLGVDYAAPEGTPVWAPADGVVAAAGYDQSSGNRLALRHPGGYESHFLHLSRFARGLHVGDRVSQREVIGYVGSTGLSTGPHLDYRMRRAGIWVNPLQEKFPRAERLPEAAGVKFAAYRSWLDGEEFTPLAPGTKVAGTR
jgi:murein DD-endopeptidase MepM/ murein hydrolase activator NlpD